MALAQVTSVEKKQKKSPLETIATIMDIGQSLAGTASGLGLLGGATPSVSPIASEGLKIDPGLDYGRVFGMASKDKSPLLNFATSNKYRLLP